MLSPLRNRFGIPGVISVVALAFAMLGGAYAASSSDNGKATTSAKAKKGPRGPKGATGPAGPAGAAGPAGPAGPAGAKGDAGANGATGANGSAGTAGQSVTTATEPPFGNCGEQEGVKLTASNGVKYVCNGAAGAPGAQGPAGSPWTMGGTLPSGATLTGLWGFSADKSDETPTTAQEFVLTTIPFGIPVSPGISASNAVFVTTKNNPDPTHCPGSSAAPKATSGYLCVYENTVTDGMELLEINLEAGGGKSGAALLFSPPPADGALAFGSWAVTG